MIENHPVDNRVNTVASRIKSVGSVFRLLRYIPGTLGLKVGITALFTLAVLVFNAGLFQTEAGYHYVYQNTLLGHLRVYSEPGVHLKLPLFSKVTQYKQVSTISFGDEYREGRRLTRNFKPINVRFADTYTGTVPATFRFKLTGSEEGILRLHREFRSFENLVDAMLVKNARDVTVITATHYTGEEFFQGGLNQFKSQLEDQLRSGVYVTERRQVEVEQTDLAPVGLAQEKSHKLERTRQLVWKTVPEIGPDGLPKRHMNPLDQYSIVVTQVTVGDPKPESQLDKLLVDKKQLVAERIKTIQEQETAKAQAKTEQLRKEIERTRAVQDAQREKELAVISRLKDLEVARQIAEREKLEKEKERDLTIIEVERQKIEKQKQKALAVIDKEKELAMAQASLEIQQAAAQAATFEAQAILEKGQAEAEVLAAKYNALNTNQAVYLAEIRRDIAQTLYTNLRDFRVQMPQNYVANSSAGQRDQGILSNLDVITAFSALGIMEQSNTLLAKDKAEVKQVITERDTVASQ